MSDKYQIYEGYEVCFVNFKNVEGLNAFEVLNKIRLKNYLLNLML